MKRFKFVKQFVSNIKNFLCKRLCSLVTFTHSCFFKRISHFNHYFCLVFLNNKIGQSTFAYMFNAIRKYSPSKWNALGIGSHLFCSICGKFSSKNVNKPFNKNFVCASNLNSGMEMRDSCFFAKGVTANNKTAFTVKNSCKISQLCDCIIFFNVSANDILCDKWYIASLSQIDTSVND